MSSELSMPEKRPRGDTLRIQPIRRNTEGWGLRSVPGVLSDFQRHTSHSEGQLGSSSPATETDDEWWIQSLPAFLAFPTGLVALQHAGKISGSPVGAACLVMGLVILAGVLLALLNGKPRVSHRCSILSTLKEICGLSCLSWAALCPYPNVEVEVGLGVAAAAIGFTSADPKEMVRSQPVQWLTWTLILTVYLFWTSTLQSSMALLGMVSWLATDSGVIIEPWTGLFCGIALIFIGAFNLTPSFSVIVSCLISSGSLGVFLLARADIVPTRYNPLTATLLGLFVSSLFGEAEKETAMGLFWGALAMAPSLMLRPPRERLPSGSGPRAWSVLDGILAHDDTRGIFYFFLLNFSFMLVQLLYSMLSHSLGLLSDSIHMFFDCLALLVGLVASILAKLPPSSRFPFGLAMVETVSSFANGILLLAISVGVVFEAFERISHPVELAKMGELMVVSFIGLLVNFVGIFAFGHAHAGHSHSHAQHQPDHAHSNHQHEHEHQHSHDHSHHGQEEEHTNPSDNSCAEKRLHHNDHQSDNLRGIFLHIVADTLGSVGVIVSTALTYYFGWHGFDALTSIFIAVLIFVSAVPLVTSSARRLLLSLNDSQEYELRDVLNDISTTPGVVSYTVPKFWDDGSGVRGTLHVQYSSGVSPTALREKVKSRLARSGIEHSVLQMEEEGSECWCQKEKTP